MRGKEADNYDASVDCCPEYTPVRGSVSRAGENMPFWIVLPPDRRTAEQTSKKPTKKEHPAIERQ
jgi:hypothetical protein